MSNPDLFHNAWLHAKAQALSVIAVALMFVGIYQIIDTLQYPLTDALTKLVNLVIRRAFRDVVPLAENGLVPWSFHAKMISEGVIVAVVGMFLGLWVQLRVQRTSSQ